MANINRPNPMKGFRPRFNLMWVWILIGVFIVSWNFFSGSATPQTTSWDELKETFLARNEVEKIVLVNNSRAEVFLKPSAMEELLKQKEYKNLPVEGPQLVYDIGTLDSFERKYDKYYEEHPGLEQVPYTNEVRKNMWSDLSLTTFLPIIFLVILWIWIMRGMSKGGGG